MNNCIEFPMSKTKKGYGVLYFYGKNHYAHRISYCSFNKVSLEEIKEKLVRHSCDNPSCINPMHLLIGTAQDNTDDMMRRNRHKAPRTRRGEESNKSKLSENDVLEIRRIHIKGDRKFGGSALARIYGVWQQTIHSIISRKTWSHI